MYSNCLFCIATQGILCLLNQCACVCLYMPVCMCAYIHVHLHTHVRVCVCVCVCRLIITVSTGKCIILFGMDEPVYSVAFLWVLCSAERGPFNGLAWVV